MYLWPKTKIFFTLKLKINFAIPFFLSFLSGILEQRYILNHGDSLEVKEP